MSFRILIVDPNSAAITSGIESALVEAGHRVASVCTFEQASLQLSLDCPDLLVTAVRLGAFNGMHLLFRFRAACPESHLTRFLSPDRRAPLSDWCPVAGGSHPHDPPQSAPVAARVPAPHLHRHVARAGARSWWASAGNDGWPGRPGSLEIELHPLGYSEGGSSLVKAGRGGWVVVVRSRNRVARQWHGIVDALH
jgi:hypothetical protein